MVPFVTRNVVIFRRWNSSIISPSRLYNVGSPVREIATWFGFHASENFSLETLGFPLNPESRCRWASIDSSTTKPGSSAWTRESEPHSWVRQQNRHPRLHESTVGVIWRQRWLLIP